MGLDGSVDSWDLFSCTGSLICMIGVSEYFIFYFFVGMFFKCCARMVGSEGNLIHDRNCIFFYCIYGWRQMLDIIWGGHMCIKIHYHTLWILFL